MNDRDLINAVGLMFMDAMSVKYEPSSYAESAIRLVRESSWQPIATAPRIPDKPIDLWVVLNKRCARDAIKPHREADARSSGSGKYWITKDGKYIEGRWYYDDEGDECFDLDHRGSDATVVTHWMPLPEPPSGNV